MLHDFLYFLIGWNNVIAKRLIHGGLGEAILGLLGPIDEQLRANVKFAKPIID